MTDRRDRDQGSRRADGPAVPSRRPSRLGTAAGTAARPDYHLGPAAGFPGLVDTVWRTASAAADASQAVATLLTLDGHVPADVQLRALRPEEEAAFKAVCGVSWRDDGPAEVVVDAPEEPAPFLGEIGLAPTGRVIMRVPSQGPLASEADLVGSVRRLPWSARALEAYQEEVRLASARTRDEVADCRRWLGVAGRSGRDDILEELKEAASRTAPFVLYQDARQYTNFRDRNTITGKTLWPGHPDCAFSRLQGLPLEVWSDHDVMLVACLSLLVRSAGFARIEEANGTQLTPGHVAHLFERVRRGYNGVPGGRQVAAASSTHLDELQRQAEALRERRQEIGGRVQLYREIHGVLMHKLERVAGPRADAARQREAALCEHLVGRLPLTGGDLSELGDSIAASPAWLAEPHGAFGTGLESLVYETVVGALSAFDVDFAMSRGTRSLSRLVQFLRKEDWTELVGWELPEYFCCVVPSSGAARHFDDSPAKLADTSWAISARMQYNSWHFLPGNLPREPVVEGRDFFVPPSIPDIAYFSDQHHRGHVAARVRFSIRSPQAVEVLGRTFQGFVDLRLLRCAGRPLDEQDLLAAHRSSAFIARATGHAADLVAEGAEVEVTAFDSTWHWDRIAAGQSPAGSRHAPPLPVP